MSHPPWSFKYTQAEYKKKWNRWSRGRGPHPKTGLWKRHHFPGKLRVYTKASEKSTIHLCHWCGFYCSKNPCETCATPWDEEKSQAKKKAFQRGYFDIVKANAVRKGKNPASEQRKIYRLRSMSPLIEALEEEHEETNP